MEASMRRSGFVSAFLLVSVVVPSFVVAQERPAIDRGVAEISGARLYYELAGSGDPVVLIHGGWGDIRYWDEQFTVLARKYRVLRYDVRGYGKSSPPVEGMAYSDQEDLANLLDHLRIRNEHVVGFSMGSRIAVAA
jgi:pimeloyl-ACP methyl ester carboxylesterase